MISPQKIIQHIDAWQQHHSAPGFTLAITKKYSDDTGGYLAALLTYYGFLSLFPLLLVVVTVLQLWFKNDAHLKNDVTASISNYFPLLGNQLQANVHSMGKTGLGMAVGLLLTIYGARGAADALRYILNNVWQVPKTRRSGFPANMLQSMAILAAVGVGFMATVAVSSFSSALGHAQWVKIAANVAGFLVAAGTMMVVTRQATARHIPTRAMVGGVVMAAALIQLLLTFGGLILSHELKNLNSVYGTFALVLGLLFWLYLMAQIVVLSAEIDSVRHLRLWPRGLQLDKPTRADLHAYKLYANVQRFAPGQQVRVRFNHPK
jgi:membrane protein